MGKNNGVKQRHSFGCLFIIIPAVLITWLVQTGAGMPLNQPEFLGYGLLILIAVFAVIWWLAYGGDELDTSLKMTTLWFATLWLAAGFFALAKINSAFSPDEVQTYYRLVTEKRIDSSSGIATASRRTGMTRSCHVTITPSLAGTTDLKLREVMCEAIEPGVDGVMVKVKPGLIFPLLEDYAAVKDFELYKARLSIDDKADTGWW